MVILFYSNSSIQSNVVILDLSELETIHQLVNLVDPDSEEGNA